MALAKETAKERPRADSETALVIRAVRRAQAGDREAIGFLYGRYADDVMGYVRSIVHDPHEAEDVTQLVFTRLITSISKYQQREVPFFAWILRVSRNLALDHVRARRAIPVEEVRPAGCEEAHSGSGSRRARLDDLREALRRLPEEQREVLVLRHLAGLTPGEIASRTGRTEGSVHGLHHRGRRAIQADLRSRGLAPAVASPEPRPEGQRT
jgi:RNA polymerase sigma-70 factor, ECF subfamily